MRSASLAIIIGLAATALAQPALAQVTLSGPLPVAPLDRQLAPWWLLEPVSASLGVAERLVPSNRANLTSTYRGLGKTAAEASTAAQTSAAPLADALRTLGADKVRIETSLSVEPVYQRYKDKSGLIQDNRRADKIESYTAEITLQLEVRDLAIYRQAMAAVVASQPFNIGNTSYGLEPGNEVMTALFQDATRDAATRARTAAEAAGGKLGAVKVIDLTARACQSSALLAPGAAPNSGGNGPVVVTGSYIRGAAEDAAMAAEVVVTASRRSARPTPPVAEELVRAMAEIGAANETLSRNSAFALPFTPPRLRLATQVCVIYALD